MTARRLCSRVMPTSPGCREPHSQVHVGGLRKRPLFVALRRNEGEPATGAHRRVSCGVDVREDAPMWNHATRTLVGRCLACTSLRPAHRRAQRLPGKGSFGRSGLASKARLEEASSEQGVGHWPTIIDLAYPGCRTWWFNPSLSLVAALAMPTRRTGVASVSLEPSSMRQLMAAIETPHTPADPLAAPP